MTALTTSQPDGRPAERARSDEPAADPAVLAVRSVDVVLGRGRRAARILAGVDLDIRAGEIVGVVGETGSGKTTLARAIAGLVPVRSGRVTFEGRPVSELKGRALRSHRRTGRLQLVFQDPLRALDPDRTVAESVGEGLELRGETRAAIDEKVRSSLRRVGLDESLLERTPGRLSGGQRQRVSIARAIATDPALLLCDEPVSALDASSRNQILRLLEELRSSLGLAIVVISHDLSSLAGIADRVVVLFHGRVVEDGPIGEVFARPRHPYTALLLASAPSVEGGRTFTAHQLRRGPEAASTDPAGSGGCGYAARCPFAVAACSTAPELVALSPDGAQTRYVACHRHDEWTPLAHQRPAGPTG